MGSKDPVLQQEYQKNNPALRAALRNAGIDLNTRLGLLLKYASNQLDEHHYHVLDSYNISCRSCWGPSDPADEYVGMVLYSKDRQTEWTANGVRVKSGYIYFKKTSDIKHIVSSQGQVHGKLYRSLFGRDPEPGLVASGFAIRHGQWKFNSGTLNFWQTSRYTMDVNEQKIIKNAVQKFAATGQKVQVIAERADKLLTRMWKVDMDQLSERMEQHLSFEGQQNLPAGGGGKSSILIEISWRRSEGAKPKSIYMRKPRHYMVHQLLLDIEAHTRFPADKNELTLGGTTLKWHERLSSAGVQEGDVLVLRTRQAVQAHAPVRRQIVGTPVDRITQYLQQLSLAGPLRSVPECDDD